MNVEVTMKRINHVFKCDYNTLDEGFALTTNQIVSDQHVSHWVVQWEEQKTQEKWNGRSVFSNRTRQPFKNRKIKMDHYM